MTLEPTDGSQGSLDSSSLDSSAQGGGGGEGGAAAAAAGMTQEAWDAMPKSWKAEMADHYKAIPPDVRKYIHEREGQVAAGFRQYSDRATRWDKLHSGFSNVFSANPSLDPTEFFSGLARNHLTLVGASDKAQRQELFKQLAQHYDIDWPGQAAASGGQGTQGPDVEALIQKALRPHVQTIQSLNKEREQERVAAAQREVDSFASDPKNKYFNDAAQTIADLIKAGTPGTIGELYELAVMRTPELKAKYLADLAAGVTQGQQSGAGTGKLNVGNSAAPATQGKPAKIDDTMNAVLDKHFPRK